MHKTVVINVVGLTPGLLGADTPFLSRWMEKGKKISIEPVLPAVTCSAQATYLTGQYPEKHGIVGNGWYFRNECEIKFWKQSNKLIESPKIWEAAKAIDPDFTCANMCWWYNMYSEADYAVTPRPNYLADGRKIPDCYSQPADLRDLLQKELGTFPLFHYWGPKTSVKSSQWIADASVITDKKYNPTLTLIYLPHMDYNLQRYGTQHASVAKDLQQIDQVCEGLINYYESKNAHVIVLSEYGITNVNRSISINRVLRENDLLAIREERGLELLDAGASDAFAVADHQVAHIYVNRKGKTDQVRKIIEEVEGVEMVLGETEKKSYHLAHDRAGELIAVADKDSWFNYYYWLDDKKAPDFARMVDIHKKPGYDPVEMFADPKIKFLMPKVAGKLLKKKLGFRVLMDIIPLDASLVKGSHGRLTETIEDRPLLISNQPDLLQSAQISPTEVYDIMLAHLKG